MLYQCSKGRRRSSSHPCVWLLLFCDSKMHLFMGKKSCPSRNIPNTSQRLHCDITRADEDWQHLWLLLVQISWVFQVLSSVTVLFLRVILCIWMHCVPGKTFPCWLVWRWQQNMPPRSPSHHSKKQLPVFSPSKIIWIYVDLKAFSIAHYSYKSGLRCVEISIHTLVVRTTLVL